MPKLIVANWKMNGSLPEAHARASAIADGRVPAKLVICPPFVHLPTVAQALAESTVSLGAQDCHDQAKGAFTGSISVPMLAELGCSFVIVGHSERRHGLGESDAMVQKKASAAHAAGLTPIICVGETLAERDAGRANDIVTTQLKGSLPEGGRSFVIAYEPVWAIGTGRNAAPDDVASMHAHIRQVVGELRAGAEVTVLYGGSVKPDNAAGLLALPEVDGFLVGGASLVPADFLAIASAG
jgi:triosephosphate isomerase